MTYRPVWSNRTNVFWGVPLQAHLMTTLSHTCPLSHAHRFTTQGALAISHVILYKIPLICYYGSRPMRDKVIGTWAICFRTHILTVMPGMGFRTSHEFSFGKLLPGLSVYTKLMVSWFSGSFAPFQRHPQAVPLQVPLQHRDPVLPSDENPRGSTLWSGLAFSSFLYFVGP